MCNYCLLYVAQRRVLPALFDVVWEYKQWRNLLLLCLQTHTGFLISPNICTCCACRKLCLCYTVPASFVKQFIIDTVMNGSRGKTIFVPRILLKKCCDFAFSCVYFYGRNRTVNFFHYTMFTSRGRNPLKGFK